MAIKIEKVIRTAEKLVAKGKIEPAIKEYRKVLAENPNDANTLNRVGDLYARIERYDEAVKLFSQIAEQYATDGFYVKAIAIYKKIIKLDPTVLKVYERLAELYHKQGLLNEARTQYQILADYYTKHDNATSAITIYQRMSELEPDNASLLLKLAELFEKQRLTDKALGTYRKLADLFVVNGSIDEATQVYFKALDLGSSDLALVRNTVGGLLEGGHRDAAQRVFDKAVALNPDAEPIGLEVGLVELAPEPEPEPEPAAIEIPEVSSSLDGTDVGVSPDTPLSFAGDATLPVSSVDATIAIPDFGSGLDADPAPPAAEGAAFDLEAIESGAVPAAKLDDSGFDFDLDSDEIASTQVLPPADMMDKPPGLAADEDELDLDFDLEDDASPQPAAVEEEVDLDWSMDDDEIEIELEDEVELEDAEFEIDLDAPEAEPEAVQAAEPMDEEPELDEASKARRVEDLLAEAEVFAKYGLREKALGRLDELLELDAEHLAGLILRARLDLEGGRQKEALKRANEISRLVRDSGPNAPWDTLHAALLEAGLALDEDEVTGEPAADEGAPNRERIAQLLEDLDDLGMPSVEDVPVEMVEPMLPVEPESLPAESLPAESLPAEALPAEALPAEAEPVELPAAELPTAPDVEVESSAFPTELAPSEGIAVPVEASPEADIPVEATANEQSLDEPFGEIEAFMQSAAEGSEAPPALDLDEEASPPPPTPSSAPNEGAVVSLVDELDLEGLDLGDAAPQPAEEDQDESTNALLDTPQSAAEALDETGMSWLDDVAESAAESDTPAGESIFDDEDDFFNLAAELEEELGDDEPEVPLETAQEQSLEEIIDGFKQGVAENLSSEDYDTHFNLGIAYREMGLLDEAIGAFQLASKDPRYIVECSSMLGMCFLEKGLPELAVKWYQKGLAVPEVGETQSLGLLYDMGNAYISMGDSAAAYKTFVEIYGMNSNYRDVSTKLQELSAGG